VTHETPIPAATADMQCDALRACRARLKTAEDIIRRALNALKWDHATEYGGLRQDIGRWLDGR